jgi:hypothetical protein
LKWQFDFGPDTWIGHASPAISADGTIYCGVGHGTMDGGSVIAINSNGTERWRKRIANIWVGSSPTIDDEGTVYIGSTWEKETGASYGYLHAFGFKDLEADANGPYYCMVDKPVQFIGFADGGYPPYSYNWDFGDGVVSYEQNPIHNYTSPGNYTVILTVTDSTNGPNSTVNDTTWALIREFNNPPTAPFIYGPTKGTVGISYEYTFVATDPEGDDIYYVIDWGDGAETGVGPYQSGEEAVTEHTWETMGIFTLRVKAIDRFGAMSNWATLEVSIPKGKTVFNFLELRFPKIYSQFTYLMNFLYW